ncbi:MULTISPECIES: cyclase family protein [Rhodomicrobium]|uniref:cyclase family protein n=1 Tax=Rhodomicrobium TaxID=1068 RepID=UPI000B4B2455|nr:MULTISPECIES: cyclase family protein [Rhodomicrobium]
MRWKRRPEGSNWGDFGPDDEAGRLNLITPEKLLQGIAEVRDGRSFCLSLPLDYPGGNLLNAARHPPQRLATKGADGAPRYLVPLSATNAELSDVICDDRVLIHTQYSTQWDALSHVGSEFDADGDGVAEAVFYNGWRGGEHIVLEGGHGECGAFEGAEAKRLGIERMAERCVQGRAVLIDLHAIHGDAMVDIGFDALDEAMRAQGAAVEAGDMVCLHTGFTRKVLEMNRQPNSDVLHRSCAALDGRDPRLQEWVRDSGLAIIAADNYAVERYPNRSGEGRRALLPLHELCLFKLGIHLGELWWLSELAAYLRGAGRTRFLLTAPPLRLPGAVGSPTTPIATV